MAVDNTHELYDAMLPRWEKMRDVCADEDTIKEAGSTTIGQETVTGTTYLRPLDKQTATQFGIYKDNASFVPFTGRIIDGFTGMVMRKPVMLTDTDKDKVSNFVKNVDGAGHSMDLFVAMVIKSYLKYKRCGTLVEMPVVDRILSVADIENNGIMPKFAFYDTFSILNWRTTIIDNTEVLSMVVLREEVEESEPLDEFDTQTEYQYRVLELDSDGFYRQRLFNSNKEHTATYTPRMNGSRMTFIPFVIHGGVTPTFPDLIGIANLNLHHYKKDAQYSHGLHYTALPTAWQSGVDPDEDGNDTIGPQEVWQFESAEAKCGMLEFTGKGLGEIANKKEEIVETIVMLTSRILAPQQVSNETALGAAIRSSSETSTLAGQVSLVTEDMSQMYKVAMTWAGASGDFLVTINKDFIPIQLSGADSMAYMTAWIKGAISYESLFDIYKRGELIPADRDIEDEKGDIDAEQVVRRQVEVEMAEKLGKATAQDEGLADQNLDNNFK